MFGKILGAVAGGIGGGSSGGGGSQTQVTTVQVPEWLDTQNKALVDRAVGVSNTPFTPYTDPRIAGFNQDYQDLFSRIRSTQNQFQPLVGKATTAADALMARSAGPTSEQLQGFMNPYIQNVIDSAKRQQGVSFAQQNAQRARQSGMQNAFGNVATDLMNLEAERNFNTRMDDLQYQGLADAFTNAQEQFNQGTGTMQNALQSYLQTGQAGQQMTANDLNLLQQMADTQRGAEQSQLDFNYDEFMRRIEDPQDKLNFLAGIMNPMSNLYRGQTTVGTTPKTKSSGLGNVLGAASTIGGLFGLADGGKVRSPIEQYADSLRQRQFLKNRAFEVTRAPTFMQDVLSGAKNISRQSDVDMFGGVVNDKYRDEATAAIQAAKAPRMGPSMVGPVPPIDESLLMDTASVPSARSTPVRQINSPVAAITSAPGVDGSLLQQIFQRLGKEDTVAKPKFLGREINMPLLMAGLSMLGTRGDLTSKIAAGAQAGFGAYDEINNAEKAAYDKQTQDLMTMFDIQNKLEQQRIANQQKAAKRRGKDSSVAKDKKAIPDEVGNIQKIFGENSPEAAKARETAKRLLKIDTQASES